MNVEDRLRAGFEEFFKEINQREADGLHAFYHVGGRGMRMRWSRPRAMTLAEMQRVIAALTRRGHQEEAAALREYGRQRFGLDAILSREDALVAMARLLRVPVTELLE